MTVIKPKLCPTCHHLLPPNEARCPLCATTPSLTALPQLDPYPQEEATTNTAPCKPHERLDSWEGIKTRPQHHSNALSAEQLLQDKPGIGCEVEVAHPRWTRSPGLRSEMETRPGIPKWKLSPAAVLEPTDHEQNRWQEDASTRDYDNLFDPLLASSQPAAAPEKDPLMPSGAAPAQELFIPLMLPPLPIEALDPESEVVLPMEEATEPRAPASEPRFILSRASTGEPAESRAGERFAAGGDLPSGPASPLAAKSAAREQPPQQEESYSSWLATEMMPEPVPPSLQLPKAPAPRSLRLLFLLLGLALAAAAAGAAYHFNFYRFILP